MPPVHLLHMTIYALEQCRMALVHLLHILAHLFRAAVHSIEEFVGSLVSSFDHLSKLAPGHAPVPDREDPDNESEDGGTPENVCQYN